MMRPLRNAASYAAELLAHLPKGAVWPKSLGNPRTPNWTGLLMALGQEPSRADIMVRTLLAEMDPRTAEGMYPDWLQAYGLPDACLAAPVSEEVQRQRLVDLVTMKGSTTPKFLTAIAYNLGYDIYVQTWTPSRCGMFHCGDWLRDTPWAFAMQIHSENVAVRRALCGSARSGDSLCAFGNDPLQCIITKHVRATTLPRLTFGYSDPQNTFGTAVLWEEPGPGNGVDTALPEREAGASYFLVGTFAAEAFIGSDAAYALIVSATRVAVGATAGADQPRATVAIAPDGLSLISIVQRDCDGERSIDVRINGADVGSVTVAGDGPLVGDMIAWTNGGLAQFGLKQWPIGKQEVDWLERVLARQFNIPLADWPVDLRQGDI